MKLTKVLTSCVTQLTGERRGGIVVFAFKSRGAVAERQRLWRKNGAAAMPQRPPLLSVPANRGGLLCFASQQEYCVELELLPGLGYLLTA